MSQGQIKLEKFANVAIVIAAVLFVAMWGLYFLRSSNHPSSGTVVPDYVLGDVLPDAERVRFPPGTPTVVLFVNSQCRFCTASMPFYRTLTTEESKNYEVLAVSREPLEGLRSYLGSHAVTPNQIVSLNSDTPLRLTKTPTVIVTDQTRVVRGIWVGGLSATQQREVLAALGRPQS